MALFYGLLSLARYWTAPVNLQVQIDLSPTALPAYAFFSVARLAVAYSLSLTVSLIYGYVAANNSKAERLMIPILDTLQSIPVLCFLPGVMISMIALFPTTQFGVELGSILLIFTGQVWNMAFSVYSSLKSIPGEIAGSGALVSLELVAEAGAVGMPHAAIALIWNSMMSVAAGWFALMVCEMFVLGNRDLRLPGLGSYLQTASMPSDQISGVGIDHDGVGDCSDRPAHLASHHRLEREVQILEQVEGSEAPRSRFGFRAPFETASRIARASVAPARERLTLYFARTNAASPNDHANANLLKWTSRVFAALARPAFYIDRKDGHDARVAGASELRDIFWAQAPFSPVELHVGARGFVDDSRGSFRRLSRSSQRSHNRSRRLRLLYRHLPCPGSIIAHDPHWRRLGIASMFLLLLGTQWTSCSM